jgi:hypothetical protein
LRLTAKKPLFICKNKGICARQRYKSGGESKKQARRDLYYQAYPCRQSFLVFKNV